MMLCLCTVLASCYNRLMPKAHAGVIAAKREPFSSLNVAVSFLFGMQTSHHCAQARPIHATALKALATGRVAV